MEYLHGWFLNFANRCNGTAWKMVEEAHRAPPGGFLFGDGARLDALRADDHFDGLAVHFCVNFLEIGKPAAVSQVVGVADPMTDGGTLPAYFTAT
jgi:hypothetical protein